MPLARTTFFSWLAVTLVYLFALYFDGAPLDFRHLQGQIAFIALVGFIVALYFATFGTTAWYVISRRDRIFGKTFVYAGIIASIPMLVICILSGEPEWVVATMVAGPLAGGIYAWQMCKTVGT